MSYSATPGDIVSEVGPKSGLEGSGVVKGSGGKESEGSEKPNNVEVPEK